MSKLGLRELTIEDEPGFTKCYEDWKNEDIAWNIYDIVARKNGN